MLQVNQHHRYIYITNRSNSNKNINAIKKGRYFTQIFIYSIPNLIFFFFTTIQCSIHLVFFLAFSLQFVGQMKNYCLKPKDPEEYRLHSAAYPMNPYFYLFIYLFIHFFPCFLPLFKTTQTKHTYVPCFVSHLSPLFF